MILALLISFLLLQAAPAAPAEAPQEETVDVAGIIFEHIGDDYEWHIFSWGDRHVVLHLPVIVHSSTGWHVFSSKRLEHGEAYEGLKIDPEKGKIVEVHDNHVDACVEA